MGPSTPAAPSLTHDEEYEPARLAEAAPTACASGRDALTALLNPDTPDVDSSGTPIQDMTTIDGGGGEAPDNDERPPLPPRPVVIASSSSGPTSPVERGATRPSLQSKATTAVSSIDIQTLTFPDGSRGTFSTAGDASAPGSVSGPSELGSRKASRVGSDVDDATSILSYTPTARVGGDLDSLIGGSLGSKSPAWKLLSSQTDAGDVFEAVELSEDDVLASFEREFEEIADVDTQEGNEEQLLSQWKSKLKHYMIFSSAGKPIWSRHGDQNLINSYIGIIQTIISFYEEAGDPLRSFTAGRTRFVVLVNGPLYFIAISKLNESDVQLRLQLDALYMQILSTLTLPTLTHLFTNRPSTDLRRPLQGTDPLLCSLADNFTRGSPSSLLSALECLKIRKSQRHVINNTLLKARNDKLLYGLIVAGGRLVSVIRPKRHSLHPGDLQLIFNMLFEAGGVKAGGGENWIPLCLPGFNNRGYLYMYVSFLGDADDAPEPADATAAQHRTSREDDVAVLLISADKESFFALQQMRDDIVAALDKNGSMAIIRAAVAQGRPRTTDIVPGTPVRHFLYRSRANVQFTMPTFSPDFDNLVARRRLLSLYHAVHATVHAKTSHLRVLHATSPDAQTLAWITPTFELFCVAAPRTQRTALTQSANKIVQWVRREEERLFIIGGAVF